MKMYKKQPLVTAGDLIFAKNTPEYQNPTPQARGKTLDSKALAVSKEI